MRPSLHERLWVWRYDWLPYRSAPCVGYDDEGHMIMGEWHWNFPWKIERRRAA